MAKDYTFVLKIIRNTYSSWYVRHNHVQTNNFEKIDFSKGPFLLVSNHCGAYDPIIISSVMTRNVSWVTGAYLFKSKFLNVVFKKICRCIPKQQGQSDFSCVREMQRTLRDGRVVGIFPEGTRTWDGDIAPYSLKTLAKMIRIFSVPTVFINLEGCFAQQPRWASYYREGQGIVVNFKKCLSVEEMKKMSLEELEEVVSDNLNFSNDKWKIHNAYNFVSAHRAEGIQRLFYMCPSCKTVSSIKASGNDIECLSCHAKATVTDKDDIESQDIKFKKFSQWHKWEAENIINENEFPAEKGILFQVGKLDNNGKLKTVSKNIEVSMKNGSINVKTSKGPDYAFPINQISSLILNAKQTMELVYDDMVYRVRLLPDASSLKYQEYYIASKNRQCEE